MTSDAGFLQQGMQAFEQGRYADAIGLFQQACQHEPPDSVEYVRSQINLVRAYERTRQFDKALALCQQLVSHTDTRVNTWAKQALQSLSTLLGTPAYSPPPSTPLLQTAKAALQEKRFEEAIATLETYITTADPTDQDYAQAQMWLAKAYKGNRQPEAAIALAQQLVNASDPLVQTWAQQFLASLAVGAVLNVVAPEAVPHLPLSGKKSNDTESSGIESNTANETAAAHAPLKSLDQLKAFYKQHLRQDLTIVERDRKALVQQILLANLLFLVIPGVIALILLAQGTFFFWVLTGFTFTLTLWVFIYSTVTGKYYQDFKRLKVVEKIVHAINADLTYSPYGFPSNYSLRTAYRESELFSHLADPDRFVEGDVVAGWVGDTYIIFGEVMAEGARSRNASQGEAQMEIFSGISYLLTCLIKGRQIVFEDFFSQVYGDIVYYPIFKGILFAANFNKQFKHKTMVVPDVAERFLGGMGKFFQSFNKRYGNLVKLEDVEFERYFAVYSGDQIEARYILSTSMMERLTRFRKRSGRDVYVSFVNHSIYVAIAYEEDLFEPKLFKSMLDFQPIQEYFENLQLVIGIVEELKLNRRIWGT